MGRFLFAMAERSYDRSDDGKFAESPGGGGGGGASDKPKRQSPEEKAEQRAEEKRAEVNANREKVAEATDMPQNLAESLTDFADPDEPQALSEKNAADLESRGLIERDGDGNPRLSPAGRAYLNAAKRGDVASARDALSRGKDAKAKTDATAKAKADKAAAREAKAKAAEAKAKAKEEKPKGGGGGGGGGSSPEDKAKEKADAQAKSRSAVADATGIDTDQADALAGLLNPESPVAPEGDARDALLSRGLIELDSAGEPRATSAGRAYMSAANRGNAAAAKDALSRGRDTANRKMTKMEHVFIAFDPDSLTKADDDECIVVGYATSTTMDQQGGVWQGKRYDGDIVSKEAVQSTLDDYMTWANVRTMHRDTPVGTVIKAEPEGDKLKITARIVDADAVKKIRAGIYKGFSIGGRILEGGAKLITTAEGKIARLISKMLMTEISLVDRPANPQARFVFVKREEEPMPDETDSPITALHRLAGERTTIAKAAPDPAKIVQQLQLLRNDMESAGDPEGAELMTQAIKAVLQAVGDADRASADMADAAAAEADAAADEEAIAMAARSELKKAARMRMGKRMPGLESLAKSLLQLAADAGSEWASRLMKAAGADADTVTAKALSVALNEALQPIAKGILIVNSRVEDLERQPVAGGPLARGATNGAITKALVTTPDPAPPAVRQSDIDRLRQLAASDPSPTRRQQYAAQLAAMKER